MARCEVCGNDYDKSFEVQMQTGGTHAYCHASPCGRIFRVPSRHRVIGANNRSSTESQRGCSR